MRLLNVYSFQFEEFTDEQTPPYVITSHRWVDKRSEASYRDVVGREDVGTAQDSEKTGFKKVRMFCIWVRGWNSLNPGKQLQWIWIDTCCINQESSAEVSKSINSMCAWYNKAQFCLAYIADYPYAIGPGFRDSVWFTRGWTLQELLAPRCVVFLNAWVGVLGHKCGGPAAAELCAGCKLSSPNLNTDLERITGIPSHVLMDFDQRKSLDIPSRMAWALNRKTTEPEDIAYCLLGIFEVHLPLIYGEGADEARRRLEEEVRRKQRSGRYSYTWPQPEPHSFPPSVLADFGPVSAAGPSREQIASPESLQEGVGADPSRKVPPNQDQKRMDPNERKPAEPRREVERRVRKDEEDIQQRRARREQVKQQIRQFQNASQEYEKKLEAYRRQGEGGTWKHGKNKQQPRVKRVHFKQQSRKEESQSAPVSQDQEYLKKRAEYRGDKEERMRDDKPETQ